MDLFFFSSKVMLSGIPSCFSIGFGILHDLLLFPSNDKLTVNSVSSFFLAEIVKIMPCHLRKCNTCGNISRHQKLRRSHHLFWNPRCFISQKGNSMAIAPEVSHYVKHIAKFQDSCIQKIKPHQFHLERTLVFQFAAMNIVIYKFDSTII